VKFKNARIWCYIGQFGRSISDNAPVSLNKYQVMYFLYYKGRKDEVQSNKAGT